MLLLLYVYLGFLLVETHGHFSTSGASILTISLLFLLYHSFRPVRFSLLIDGYSNRFILICLVVFSFLLTSAFKPALFFAENRDLLLALRLLMGIAALCLLLVTLLVYKELNVSNNYIFYLFTLTLGLLLISRLLVIIISPNPVIDVFTIDSQAVDFFLDGLNPYSQVYPDIYNGKYDYEPGYTYWPSYFLFSIPFKMLGDIRLSTIFSDLVTGYFIYLFAKNQGKTTSHSMLWMLAWVSFPISLFFLEQAWIDSFMIMGVAIFMWALYNRKLTVAAVALGVFSASKQYAPLVGVLALPYLYSNYGWKKTLKISLISFVVFLAFMAPFMYADFDMFYEKTIGMLIHRDLRIDSLSLPALLARGGDLMQSTILPGWFYNVLYSSALITGLAAVAIRKDRSLYSYSLSLVTTFGLIFVFGKVAFCNYYYLLSFFILITLLVNEDNMEQS